MAKRKAEVVVTCNIRSAQEAQKILIKTLTELQKKYDALVAAGKQNDEETKKLKRDMDSLASAVETNESVMSRIQKVMDNLTGSTLRQLNSALREVKKQMSSKSTDSGELDELREKYSAITEQIKILKGESIDIGAGVQNLNAQTDAWLTRAIAKQKELVSQIQQGTQAYMSQKSVLDKLEEEQKQRRYTSIRDKGESAMNVARNSSSSSASQLREARQDLIAYRDNIGSKGIDLGSDQDNLETIRQINEMLKSVDAQIESINGKSQEVVVDTQRLVQEVSQIDFEQATPKQLKAKLDEVNKALSDIGKNDPMRTQLVQSAEQLQTALDEVEGKVVDVSSVLANLDDASPKELQDALDQVEKKLSRLGQNDRQRKSLLQDAEKLRGALNRVKGGAVDVNKVLANLKSASLQDLKKAASQLEQEIARLNRESDAQKIAAKREQLRQLNKEIQNVNQSIAKQESAWSKVFQMVSAYMGITMLLGKAKEMLTKILHLNLEYSDQLADIRKVSGLAMKDINELSDSLAKIDTRTTLEELAQISYAGAKLGIGKFGTEGLLEFTRAANQVNVALREDLGADALTALSKITEVMGLIPKMGVEQSMLATGSAMFQLSATSTATAGNIVEFAKRLTGMARTAGITTDQLLALGSAADSMYLSPEVASTAFNKFISSLQTQHNLIEKELEIEPGTISRLYEAGDIVDAMVLVFERMREKGNMNALQGVFKDLGSDGARLVNVMVTMSKNVDMLKTHLAVSNKAFHEATAVTNEYNIQQETAQALMERASNLWEKAFVNPEGVDNVKSLAESWYNLSNSLTSSVAFIGSLKAGIWMVITGVKALILLMPVLLSFLMVRGAFAAWSALRTGIDVVRTAITRATAAQTAFNAATKANVWAAILSVVVSVGVALFEHARAAREAAKEVSKLNKVEGEIGKEMSRLNAEIDSQKEKIEKLISKIHDENTAQNDRIRYIKEVKEMWDGYNASLDQQGRFISDNSAKLDTYITKLRQAKIAELSEGKIEDAILRQKEAEYEKKRLAEKRQQIEADAAKAEADEIAAADEEYVDKATTPNYGMDNMDNVGSRVADDADHARKVREAKEKRQHATDEIDAEISENNRILEEVSEEIDKWTTVKSDALAALVEEPLGVLGEEAKDKEALAEQKRLNQEQKRRLREDLKQAQDEARAIMDNIRNFYQRQITQVLKTANEQNWDEALIQSASDAILARQNLALSQARKGIAGVRNEWDEFKQTMQRDMLETQDEIGYNESQELLDLITTNSVAELHDRINGIAKDLKMPFNAATDAIWKNATMDEKANETAKQRQSRERQKLLLADNYTKKVDADYAASMTRLGYFGINEEQSQTLIGGGEEAEKLLEERAKEIAMVFENARNHLVDLIAIDNVNTDSGRISLLEILIGPDWDMDASRLKEVFTIAGDDLKQFYDEMIKYANDYLEAEKKAEDRAKKLADFRWEHSERKAELDKQTQTNSLYQKGILQHINPEEANKKPEYGVYGSSRLVTDFGVDPELETYRLKMQAAKDYYDFLVTLGAEENLLKEQEKAIMEAQAEYIQQLTARIKNQMEDVLGMAAPVEDFGSKVGEAFATMTEDADAGRKALKAAIGDMINSFMKQTVEMAKEYVKRRIMQKINDHLMSVEIKKQTKTETALESKKQDSILDIQELGGKAKETLTKAVGEKTQEVTEKIGQEALATQQTQTQAEIQTDTAKAEAGVPLGIASGASKIIGSLGWWGIPLVAVITALLNGLLSFAMSKVSSLFGGGKSGATDTAPQTKLVSGMLTYDSGNVQAFRGVEDGKTYPVVGSDGKVYAAKDGGELSTGLVKDPITTLVNGQPALVAEKGPEMVIGRETTAAMMMARPDILAEIVKFDRQRSGRTYRAYDAGNLNELQISMPTQVSNSEEMTQLCETINTLASVLAAIQKNGIPAVINKFGRNGVANAAQSGSKFMQRNSSDPLWKS